MQKSRALSSSGATGSTCGASGPYRCNSHTAIIVVFKRGDKFSACPAGKHNTTWAVVKESEEGAAVTT